MEEAEVLAGRARGKRRKSAVDESGGKKKRKETIEGERSPQKSEKAEDFESRQPLPSVTVAMEEAPAAHSEIIMPNIPEFDAANKYGAEYLLRMLVRLPDFFCPAAASDEFVAASESVINQLIRSATKDFR